MTMKQNLEIVWVWQYAKQTVTFEEQHRHDCEILADKQCQQWMDQNDPI